LNQYNHYNQHNPIENILSTQFLWVILILRDANGQALIELCDRTGTSEAARRFSLQASLSYASRCNQMAAGLGAEAKARAAWGIERMGKLTELPKVGVGAGN
jgi:hypothetical protein